MLIRNPFLPSGGIGCQEEAHARPREHVPLGTTKVTRDPLMQS
jgi:hypothetical protein